MVADAHASPAAELNQAFAALPLHFEANSGQIDAAVLYMAKSPDRTIFLTPKETVISLRGDAATAPSVVRLRFNGSDGARSITAEDRAETRTNYYMGHERAHWRVDVPSFSRVRYRSIYDGIDVVYYGNEREFEYDLIVAPHANPGAIDLAFDGADWIGVDSDGDLVLTTAAGQWRQKTPTAYQVVGGKHRLVSASYVRRGPHDIGIALARYDPTRPLIIDPLTLFYSTYLGGSVLDKVLAMAADGAGNTYVTGLTQSPDFPIANAAHPFKAGTTDVFVAKIDAGGTKLIYSTYLGGALIDAALGIALDSTGNAFVTGYTASPDFPTTPNVAQPALNGTAYDAFVAKLGPTGTLAYSTFLGGSDLDIANAIAVDVSGSAYVAGYTCSADFPVANAFQPVLIGPPLGCFSAQDAFITKVAPGGIGWTYSTYFGGADKDEAKSIALDAQGGVAITGVTSSADLPGAGIPLATYAGMKDAFVSHFGTSGLLDYSTYYGGSDDDDGFAIAADTAGALYVTGSTHSPDIPTVSAFQTDLHGPGDAFVLKMVMHPEPSATASLVYASYLGGRDDEIGRAIVVSGGMAYVTGDTHSPNFPLHAPLQSTLKGSGDAFISRIGPNGVLTFSTFFGGNDEDSGSSIALSNGLLRGSPTMHVGGVTYSTDLSTPNALQPVPGGAADGFVAKLGYTP